MSSFTVGNTSTQANLRLSPDLGETSMLADTRQAMLNERSGAEPLLTKYFDELTRLLTLAQRSAQPAGLFEPPWALPKRSEQLDRFFAPSSVGIESLPVYDGHELSLLDLRRDETTRTTKTNPSLVMVARAVRHIQDTGQPIAIITPSSANKATALRSAVLRAINHKLVTASQLQIVSVVPAEATSKLWSSELVQDAYLYRRNPVLLHHGQERFSVKELVKQFAQHHAHEVEELSGVRLWFTLDLANYMAADALRAYEEYAALGDAPRWQAHSVSSAFGLLGHNLGVETIRPVHRPGYLLVQHLDTPDMVLHLTQGTFDRGDMPSYQSSSGGVFRQNDSPHFPSTTSSVDEVLDTTFYTHTPITQPAMERLIERQGGTGIVVSLDECLSRYGHVRESLANTQVNLPADPRKLREWSLVMAMTGVFTAIDRGLVPTQMPIVVHGSGSYAEDDYEPIPQDKLVGLVVNDINEAVSQALTD